MGVRGCGVAQGPCDKKCCAISLQIYFALLSSSCMGGVTTCSVAKRLCRLVLEGPLSPWRGFE